jgi:hypothetical protein
VLNPRKSPPDAWTPWKLGQWQRHLFENLTGASEKSPGPSQREKQLADKVEHRKARLARKDSVIAEISAEYVH